MPNHRCRRKRFHLHEGTLKPDSEEALLGVFLQGRWQLGPASSQESHSRGIFFGVDFTLVAQEDLSWPRVSCAAARRRRNRRPNGTRRRAARRHRPMPWDRVRPRPGCSAKKARLGDRKSRQHLPSTITSWVTGPRLRVRQRFDFETSPSHISKFLRPPKKTPLPHLALFIRC